MDDETERRYARNEQLFRETNEAIERGQWPGEPEKLVRFRCECSHLECGEALEISLGEYERVRANPRRFVVIPGHQIAEIEDVVARTEKYVVVEKRDTAGEVAAATDPRS